MADEIDAAHGGLIARPAHPANMDLICGKCHRQITFSAHTTSHFTVSNEINLVRRHFGATDTIHSPPQIPARDFPKTVVELADDLLRRRCLRCHVYVAGDDYAKTSRPTGCAACHFDKQDGRHEFIAKPRDEKCLSCHYGNRVGSDYYGRFEHDFKFEYRTPYLPDGEYPPRPYGVEFHNLRPDIHQLAGLACIDCHSGAALMGTGGRTISQVKCRDCHLYNHKNPPSLPGIIVETGQPLLTLTFSGKKILIPQAEHPAHQQYDQKATCVTCHAQWTFTDRGTHLLRSDTEDFEEWEDLIVQGSQEIEAVLLNGIYADDQPARMSDQMAGVFRPGAWYKGFETRRWETPLIGLGPDGRLTTLRPILDLHLSYVDAAGETIFNGEQGKDAALRPYTPHTIGRAGAFYRQRLHDNTETYRSLPIGQEMPR